MWTTLSQTYMYFVVCLPDSDQNASICCISNNFGTPAVHVLYLRLHPTWPGMHRDVCAIMLVSRNVWDTCTVYYVFLVCACTRTCVNTHS